MQIQSWPLKQPKPYEGNPRKISAQAISKVANSIKAFGFQQPIVVDRDGVIIVGHTRLLAAKKLKLKEVPVLVADLDEASAKAYRMADNRTSQETEWDEERLLQELGFLQGLNFDLDTIGFEDAELVRLLGDDALANAAEPDVDAEKSRLLDLLTVSLDPPRHEVTEGEVYLLGQRHHLCCMGIMTGWPLWVPLLQSNDDAIFCPYPGPFVAYGKFTERHHLVMVQPDPYTCGHILDRFDECFPGDIEKVE